MEAPQISNVKYWQNNLGLLPINLFSTENRKGNFILLNGGKGDFCLQVDEHDYDDNYYFSSSWSSNTKSYVSVQEDKVSLYTWGNQKQVEHISRKTVEENYGKFYNYLTKKSTPAYSDVVPFVLNIFKKLRNLEDDKLDGVRSLNLLFLLLAAYAEGGSFDNIDNNKWGLIGIDYINAEFESYLTEFASGIQGRKPDIDLIIRHASGLLFQEAQKEALFFNKNLELFTGNLSSAYKTRNLLYSSIHYTPAYIARTIVENSLRLIDLNSTNQLSIIDPACGSGEFLMETLKQIKTKNYQGRVNVIGWDTSVSAINTTRFLLTYEQREWNGRLSFTTKIVKDSLDESWGKGYDIILMNPPFVSWDQMPKDARDSVRTSLDTSFSGKPNQASAFFYKASKHLNSGGVLGCVVPTSLFTLSAYEKLRSEISDSLSFHLIAKLGNFVFETAFVDISLFVGQRPHSNVLPTFIWTRNEKGVVSDALRELRKSQYDNVPLVDHKDYSIYTPSQFPARNGIWVPTPFREDKLYRTIERRVLEGTLSRIGDVFSVQQGIRTGANNVFKISATDYSHIPENEKNLFRPVIDNDAIKNGVIEKNTYAWYPYNKHGLIIRDEQELQAKAPFFFKHSLEVNKHRLATRPSLRGRKWWELSEPRTWQFERHATLCSTEFGKSDSFAFNETGEFLIERGYGWIPKKKLSLEDTYFYLSVFSSPLFNNLLSIYSKQLAGIEGWDLGRQHTKNIPIPNAYYPDLINQFAYKELADFGRLMVKEGTYYPNVLNEVVTTMLYPS